MSASVADEVHAIVTRAAHPVHPGESIKAQMNRAWANLGRPAMWRIKSAWWRDGSGQWSAAAVRDFQVRYRGFLEREARRVAQARATQQIVQPVAQPGSVTVVAAEYRDLVERIAALEAALRLRS